MKPFAIFLALFLASQTICSVNLSASTLPRFEGSIKTITTPIILKYRPFKKSPFSKITTFSFEKNSTKLPQQKFLGTMEAKRSDNGFLIIINAPIPNPSGNDSELFLSFSLSETGVWEGIKEAILDGKSLQEDMRAFGELFKSFYFQYDKTEGYITGDNIHNIKTELKLGAANITVEYSSKVLGTTVYNGREAMVANTVINGSFDGNMVSGGGFTLIDLETGFNTFFKTAATVSISYKGDLERMGLNEIFEIKLAKNQGAILDGNTAQSSPTLRLKKLKKLLDMGLIDKTDYEKKKNEILKDL